MKKNALNEVMRFRLTEKQKKQLFDKSNKLGLRASELVRVIIAQYLEAREGGDEHHSDSKRAIQV